MIRSIEKRLERIENLLIASKTILNLEEVCNFTGLSKSTIYKFTHFGTIPYFKQAKHLYFDSAEIENWIKSNRGYNANEVKESASTYLCLNKNG